MAETIILYDLASRENKSWSINPMKTRILLNYKQLPYKTTFVPMHQVQTKLATIGLTPYPDQPGKQYSVPAVELPSGEKVQDSWKIAEVVEKVYPSPTVHLDSRYVKPAEEIVTACFGALGGVVAGKVFERHFTQADNDFILKERLGGASIDSIPRDTSDAPWIKVQDKMQPLLEMLKEQQGPFFVGEEFSYADVYLAALLQFLRRVDEDVFLPRFLAFDESLLKFFEACQPWLQRMD